MSSSETDIREQLAALEEELREPEPEPKETPAEMLEHLRELEESSDFGPPEPPAPEPEPTEEPFSGKLVLTYTKSIVRRDEKGRISELVGANSRRFVLRDERGVVIAIDEVMETEEVETPEVAEPS